ncbi:hypothetical protein RI129_002683 [Pyrocoelia pectoralis]|uniref:Uncharacterized protein n=1 Tax=Pyrocoelia pectoralis TaxID=417401 RepID=A0AAN7VMD8_9COLE
MAIWFLFKETIVVIIICQVCVYSLDLLENLKLKRENSPELNNFLKSVLEKKEIFKNIRETANLLSHDDKSAHKTTHKKTCVITHAPPNIERRERDEFPIQNGGGGCSRENSDCYHRKECNCEKCNANNEECPNCNEKQTDTCDEENKNETGDEGISYEIFTPKPEVGKTNKEYLEFKETTEEHSKHALKNKKPKTRQSVSDIPKKSITTKTNLKNIYTKFHSKHNENEFKQNDLRNVLEETSELDTIGDFQKTDANGANINERAIDVNREQDSFNAITTSNYETMEKRQILKNSEDAFSEFSVNVDKIKRDETFSYSTPTNNHRNLENVDSFKDVVEHVAIYKSLDARNRKKFWRSPIKHRPRALYLRHHPYRHYERLKPFHNYPYIRYADKENHHSYNNKRGHEKRIRRHSQFIDYHDILPHKDMKAAHTKRIVRWDKQHGGTPVKEWINPKNPIKDDGGGSEKQLNLNSEKFLGKSVESNDYGQMQDALSGHLASLIVDKVITELKSHKELSSRFLNGLSHRQHLGRDMKVLEAFLTSEAENDLKHKEQMMHNIMAALNKLVMDVVQRQTCKRISPELRKFLIRMIKQSRREIDEDSKIAEEGVPLPVVKSSKPRKASDYQPENSFLFHKSSKEVEHDQMVGNVQEKIEMVNGLIDRYDHLKSNCKDQASDVHEYLQKHLAMLQQIMRTLQEKKKTPRIAKDTSSLTGKYAHGQHSPKKPLISSFNVDAVFKEHLKKLKDKASSNEEIGTSYLNSHSKHQESHTDINSKNHNKSETKESAVSKQYQKLAETADYLRKNREADEKIGRLFSNSKDAENEETKSVNTENIDLSKIKFEQLVPYNLG